MKKVLMIALVVLGHVANAQDSMDKVMEKRARELHRVICLNDPAQWKKFIRENYTEALINKPMKAQVEGGDGAAASSASPSNEADPVESKAKMFRMLHNDFGGSKISSINVAGEKLTMILGGNGMNGTFSLKFDKTKPYLIDGIGVEVGNVNR